MNSTICYLNMLYKEHTIRLERSTLLGDTDTPKAFFMLHATRIVGVQGYPGLVDKGKETHVKSP